MRKLVRSILSSYYREGKVYRMPMGHLRGLRVRYEEDLTFHNVLGLKDPDAFRVLSRLAKHLFGDATVVCDVGAQYGLYSLWLGRSLGKKGTVVHAFEPSPEMHKKLCDTLEINEMKCVTPIKLACSDKTGTAEFFVRESTSTSSLMSDIGGEAVKKVSVETVSLDDFYLKDGRPLPSLIKIDIEGAGALALAGAKNLLEKGRPYVLIDLHCAEEDLAVEHALDEHRYSAYDVANRKWVTKANGNLLLVPNEQKDRVEKLLR